MKSQDEQNAIRILISGKVQRVGCRRFLFEKAVELSIRGYVKNNRDGTVFVFAMGTNLQLDEFTEWCGQGSALAKVEKVKVEIASPEKHDNFKIMSTL